MGELERSAGERNKGLLWDLQDIFTQKNLLVAIVAAFIAYVVVERLRDGRPYIRHKNNGPRRLRSRLTSRNGLRPVPNELTTASPPFKRNGLSP